MKKLIIAILGLLTFISCTSTEKLEFIGKQVYENVTPIIENNKIMDMKLKGKVNLQNKEINVYHVNKMEVDNNIPKIVLDIDYNNGISDGLIIYNKFDGNFQVDFKSITNEVTTINKKIPFLIVPKNSKININLSKELIVDNTQFEIEIETRENTKTFVLVPNYLDEETNYIKQTTPIKYHTNIAYYNDKYLMNYNLIDTTPMQKTTYNYTELEKEGYFIKGKHSKGSEVIIENDREKHVTKVDEKGNWQMLLSPKGEGIIYGINEKGQKSKIEKVKWGD